MAQTSQANVKMQRVSVRKANLVASLIRKKDVSKAIELLKNTPKKSSKIFLKLLNSAIANAVNNHGMNAEKLFISLILVNEGPTLKRFRPRAKGSAYSIFKRTSNLTIELSER